MKTVFLQSLITNQYVQAVVVAYVGYLVMDILKKIAPLVGKLMKYLFAKILYEWDRFCIYLDVKKAEKKFSGAQLGEKKKEWVMQKNQKRNQRLQKFDTNVDVQIESFVGAMNTKQLALKTTIKTDATMFAQNTAASIKESVSEKVTAALTENSQDK